MTSPAQPHNPTVRQELFDSVPVGASPVLTGLPVTGPPPGSAGPPPTGTESTATRHLCAGAYLDDDFRRTCLNEVYHASRRIVAPSYGFTVIPVLWHCLRARNIAIVRDAIIVGILAVALCVSFVAVLSLLGMLLSVHFATAIWRLLRDSVRKLRSAQPLEVNAFLARSIVLLIGLAVGLSALTFIGALISMAAVSDLGQPERSTPFILAQGTAFLLLVIVFALPVGANVWRQRQLDNLTPNRPQTMPPRSQRFDEISQQQTGNTVVYSGYWPFVGSGQILDTWGFAQRLVRPGNGLGRQSEAEREFRELPFTAQEIIRYVGGQLHLLTDDPDPERRIPGLTVEDRVFLAGTEVSHLSVCTPPEQLSHIVRYPTAPARHYLACQVVSWRGELVTSVYVHFAVQGRSLYLELTTTALPPCDDRFRIVDQVDGTGFPAYLRAVRRGIVDTPRTVGSAPLNLLRAAVDGVAASVERSAGATTVNRGYDYGARVGVRELGSAEMTRNHVQTQDILKYQRVLERRVVAAVLDFLELKGVDTDEYRQRALTILSAGAVNTGGGTLNVGGDAIGTKNENLHPAGAGR